MVQVFNFGGLGVFSQRNIQDILSSCWNGFWTILFYQDEGVFCYALIYVIQNIQ